MVQAFFPLRTCQGRVPCESNYIFEFIAPDALPGGPIEIRWSVELIVRESASFDLPSDTVVAIESVPATDPP